MQGVESISGFTLGIHRYRHLRWGISGVVGNIVVLRAGTHLVKSFGHIMPPPGPILSVTPLGALPVDQGIVTFRHQLVQLVDMAQPADMAQLRIRIFGVRTMSTLGLESGVLCSVTRGIAC